MEIIEGTAAKLSLSAEDAAKVLTTVNKSALLGKSSGLHEVLVHWGHEEAALVTRVLEKDVMPSPIIRDYKWPGIYKPFNHQMVTSAFLATRSRAFCFNEAGTGKTSSVIWAADYLMTLGLVKRVLVICPLSIMYSAWQADIFNTAMHRTVGVAYGSGAKRKKVIEGGYEFVIINYDGVGVVREAVSAAMFDLIVIDEANAYKMPTTKRWRTLVKLLLPSTKLWLLTGTPAAQSPVDAYGMAKLISPQLLPKTMTNWKDKVMQQITRFKWVPKLSARDDVFRVLQPAIRYSKEECLDLPDIVHLTRDVPLVPYVYAYYKKLKSQMLIEAAGEQISAVNAAASLSKLLQISGGAVYTDERDVVEFDVSPRLQALKEVLDETINKVVIFVPYLHTIEVIRRYLDTHKYTNSIIKGDVSARNRGDIIKAFQEQPDPRILIIQPQSASHGVTLTAADTVVFWSPVMSVETYLQCIARIERVGQKNKMTVVHLQGSAVEVSMYAMLQGKVNSHQRLVDLYKQELGLEK
jgi:SNF2 family DNA or RNA helicase